MNIALKKAVNTSYKSFRAKRKSASKTSIIAILGLNFPPGAQCRFASETKEMSQQVVSYQGLTATKYEGTFLGIISNFAQATFVLKFSSWIFVFASKTLLSESYTDLDNFSADIT